MEPVHVISGTGVPLDRSDVDTDQIIPSDWLKRVERTGFGRGLFSEWRDDRDFVLKDEAYAGASILVAGPNFGTTLLKFLAAHATALWSYIHVLLALHRIGDQHINLKQRNNCKQYE